MRFQLSVQIGGITQQPAHHMMGSRVHIIAVEGVTLFHRHRRRVAFFRRHPPLLVLAFKTAERFALQLMMQLMHIQIAEGHEDGIRRVVMAAVKLQQLFVG